MQRVRGATEVSVINFDCDLEDGVLAYDYNKGEYAVQLLSSGMRR
jgi:hypothetical protein